MINFIFLHNPNTDFFSFDIVIRGKWNIIACDLSRLCKNEAENYNSILKESLNMFQFQAFVSQPRGI